MVNKAASAVADVLSECESTLADGVVLRPGERDRDYYDDDGVDGVVERRRGAVSAGSWYVRADNAIRMGGAGGVCTGGERCRGMRFGESQTRVVARRAGCRRRRRRAASRAEGWRRLCSHCTDDGE